MKIVRFFLRSLTVPNICGKVIKNAATPNPEISRSHGTIAECVSPDESALRSKYKPVRKQYLIHLVRRGRRRNWLAWPESPATLCAYAGFDEEEEDYLHHDDDDGMQMIAEHDKENQEEADI